MVKFGLTIIIRKSLRVNTRLKLSWGEAPDGEYLILMEVEGLKGIEGKHLGILRAST
jgi:hypothetical protein